MPKTAKSQTPGEALQKFIDDYQTNPFALSKSLNVAYQSVTHILQGKARISPKMAMLLSARFGSSVNYWLDIQTSADLDKLSADKKFQLSLNKITKAQKPTGKAKKEPKIKTGKRKINTLSEKRKKAAKIPGSKKARGRKAKEK
ncbi:MAG: HigA family addiction module antidote protein [Treponema sp.]|jgi:addiction module HigA family antidote|nr:HigA family addiction module antidote protein [Treponema sp.]